MKIKYTRNRTKDGLEVDPSFTLASIYLVLGIRFQSDGRPVMVTVLRDSDKTPVLVELRHFDVIDPNVPKDWCISDFGDGCYGIEPKSFSGDFWDRFYDGEHEAEQTFIEVVQKIESEH